MSVSVLVVDDSAFFRQRVNAILSADPRVRVVGMAENGRDAVEKAQSLRPDVITMDYEMPVMNGIAALIEIMRVCPTPVLMFSSLTYEGARVTLEALEAGAVDYLPKSYERLTGGQGRLETALLERVLAAARSRPRSLRERSMDTPVAPRQSVPVTPAALRTPAMRPSAGITQPAVASSRPAPASGRRNALLPLGQGSLVILGTSTGGPVALQKVLTQLPAHFPFPILLVQHMPEAFTGAFAQRLDQQCQIRVREAQDGDRLRPGLALLAPGGRQMMVDSRNGGQVRILPGDERLNYKPSVDITFGSAARHYAGKVLGIVLTGMGADGREGARLLKQQGCQIWAQNEQSCVIYGMPHAVVQAQLADQILDLSEIGACLIKVAGR